MPRYRTGHRVPLNVYDGDRPIFQAHSEHDAERFVALMNIGERIETVTAAEIAQHLEGAFDDLAAKLALDGLPSGRTVAEHLAPVVMAEVLLVSHQSHPSAPESPSEPPAGTGQRSGPCAACGHSYNAHAFPIDGESCTWVRTPPGPPCGCPGFEVLES